VPANKYALLRYRIIDRCIRNPRKQFPSKDDLRSACEEALYGSDGEHISLSTIDKDLWTMRNEGELGYYAPIKFSKNDGGYYYEDPEYTIAEVPLNEDDLNAIRAAAETLYQFKEIPLFQQFESAIEKILDRMKISASDSGKREHEIIQFERVADYKGSEFLQPLFKSCADNATIELTYRKFGQESEATYIFTPYIIKEYRNRWYVIGLEQKSQQLRTFSLDRIGSLNPIEGYKTAKSNFNAERFFKHSFGITVNNRDPEEVWIEISERLSHYLISQPIHHSQKVEILPESRHLIKINVLITIELITTIMSYGEDAIVIKPNHLREGVKAALTNALKNY